MGAASGGRVSGHVYFKGQDLLALSGEAIRHIRGNQIAMIPQDPMVSFDPVYTVGDQIVEAIRAHRSFSKKEAHARAVQLLDSVGIPKADLRAGHFPHQFSGGMAQRALIAMALACDPQVLIADEPTTALDVTVQAQILELLLELQETMDLAVILITHDMGVAASVADRVAVMYAGRIVEQADAEGLFYDPQHPYTWGLLQSTLYVNTSADAELQVIKGRPPSLITLPSGCKFHPRCPHVMDICRDTYPEPAEKEPGHMAACHLSILERSEYRPQ
jgi:oligopeptide/dipeptide ABC transporter ATP-binding protein